MEFADKDREKTPTGEDSSQPSGNKNTPEGSPMSMPVNKKGDRIIGNAKVRLAGSVLAQAMAAFGADTDEANQVLELLRSLESKFGGESIPELIPAQILDLVRGEPSLQKGQPIQQAMTPQQPQVPPDQKQGM